MFEAPGSSNIDRKERGDCKNDWKTLRRGKRRERLPKKLCTRIVEVLW